MRVYLYEGNDNIHSNQANQCQVAELLKYSCPNFFVFFRYQAQLSGNAHSLRGEQRFSHSQGFYSPQTHKIDSQSVWQTHPNAAQVLVPSPPTVILVQGDQQKLQIIIFQNYGPSHL